MSRTWRTLVLVPVILLCVGRAPLRADDKVEIKVEGPMAVEDLLRAVKSMGVPLVWDDADRAIQGRKVAGPFRITGTRDEVLDALRGVLTLYDLVLIPIGSGEARMLLVMDARQSSVLVKLRPQFVEIDESNVDAYAAKDGLYVSTLLRLNGGASAAAVRAVLVRLVTGQNIGVVAEVADDALVVVDFAPNVAEIWRIVRYLDQATRPNGETDTVFRSVRLKAASAPQVAAVLVAHFTPRPEPQAGATPNRPQSSPPPPVPTLQIDADARTNQVLVSGPASLVDEVLAVIPSLDVELPQPETTVQVVRLEHVSADGAARSLMQMISQARGGFGDGPRPVIVAHAETNALLVWGTPDALTALRRVIAEMDVERQEPPK